jgi:hypothetical protein
MGLDRRAVLEVDVQTVLHQRGIQEGGDPRQQVATPGACQAEQALDFEALHRGGQCRCLSVRQRLEIRRRRRHPDDLLNPVGCEHGPGGGRIPADKKGDELCVGFPARGGDDAETGFLDARCAVFDQDCDVGHVSLLLSPCNGVMIAPPFQRRGL